VSALERLRELVAAEGEPIAGALLDGCSPNGDAGPAALAAAGPRAGGAPAEYELLVEAIYEGYLLHYGVSRVVSHADPDLALLAGDRLYAIGLERLVALGDLEAVRELADVIALCSLLVARGDRAACEPLWRAGARAVGWGADPGYEEVKSLLRSDGARGREALLALDQRGTGA
jgi:hypothetical protein